MIAAFMALHLYAQITLIIGVSWILGKAMAVPVILTEVFADWARAKMPRRGKRPD